MSQFVPMCNSNSQLLWSAVSKTTLGSAFPGGNVEHEWARLFGRGKNKVGSMNFRRKDSWLGILGEVRSIRILVSITK